MSSFSAGMSGPSTSCMGVTVRPTCLGPWPRGQDSGYPLPRHARQPLAFTVSTESGPSKSTFGATLGKARPGDTWTCVQLPGSADAFGTRGLVKVAGTVDGEPFRGAFMALGWCLHACSPVGTAVVPVEVRA